MSLAASKERPSGLDEFDFDLPHELIAQYPLPARCDSRLLHLAGPSGRVEDRRFIDILRLLRPGDVLVFNNTKVIPARLLGHRPSGGRVEFLVQRILDTHSVLTMAGANKPLRPGQRVLVEKKGASVVATIKARQQELCVVGFGEKPVDEVLAEFGHVPLPPYIQRADGGLDGERYQTVFAGPPGAVAAPTAGLHFDEDLMGALVESGIACVFITLHVGAGTFQPVRQRSIAEHRLHPERVSVPTVVCEAIERAKLCGGRVVAVGTTCVRALETLGRTGGIEPYEGETDLFLTPGDRFHIVDAMITNFHLPRSSLLMLVCAFAGTGNTLRAYDHAVRSRYRFYSYGDAMFITPQNTAGRC